MAKKQLVPTKRKPLYAIEYVEFERGWGRRHEGYSYFKREMDARLAVMSFNSDNNEPTVPDCYMVAHYVGLTDKPL